MIGGLVRKKNKMVKKKFDVVGYVDKMNHKYSNVPKTKSNTLDQLLRLKDWAKNPKKKYAYSQPLTQSGLRYNYVTGQVEDLDGDIVSMRNTLNEMQSDDLPTEAELKKEKVISPKYLEPTKPPKKVESKKMDIPILLPERHYQKEKRQSFDDYYQDRKNKLKQQGLGIYARKNK